MSENIRVEASNDDLIELKKMLYENVTDVEPIDDTEIKSGRHGEPVLVGLLIPLVGALGGAVLTKEIFGTIRHWMDTRVKLEQIRLYHLSDDRTRLITHEDLNNS